MDNSGDDRTADTVVHRLPKKYDYINAVTDSAGYNLCRTCEKPVGKPEHRNADKHFVFALHKGCVKELKMK